MDKNNRVYVLTILGDGEISVKVNKTFAGCIAAAKNDYKYEVSEHGDVQWEDIEKELREVHYYCHEAGNTVYNIELVPVCE